MNKYLVNAIWLITGIIRTCLLICKYVFDIFNSLGLEIVDEIEELKIKERKRIFK